MKNVSKISRPETALSRHVPMTMKTWPESEKLKNNDQNFAETIYSPPFIS